VTAGGSADPSGQRNRSGPICSIGFLNASRFRGLSLSSAATQSRSASLCTDRSVPLGKYCRSSPLDAPMFVKRRRVRRGVGLRSRFVGRGGHPSLRRPPEFAIRYRDALERRDDVVPLPVPFKSVMLGGEQLGSGAENEGREQYPGEQQEDTGEHPMPA